jgi:hypothetical protein
MWKKSSRSAGNGNCVEIGFRAQHVGLRDSKDVAGEPLFVDHSGWLAFLRGVKRGEFDRG